MPPLPVLSPEQSAAWDASAVRGGRRAGDADGVRRPRRRPVLAARYAHRLRDGVLIAAGPGNNGGDGWVLARALQRLDVPVWVTRPPGPGRSCARRWPRARGREGVREVAPDGPWPSVGLVVDALLGTGARGAPRAADGRPARADLRSRGAGGGHRRPDRASTWRRASSHGAARADAVDHVRRRAAGPPARPGRGRRRSSWWTSATRRADPAWPSLVTDPQAAEWLRRLRSRDHKGDRGRVVIVGRRRRHDRRGAHGRRARRSAPARDWCTSSRRPGRSPRWGRPSRISRRSRIRSIGRHPATLCSSSSAAPTRWSSVPGSGREPRGARWLRRWSGEAQAVVLDADGAGGVPGRGRGAARARGGRVRWC